MSTGKVGFFNMRTHRTERSTTTMEALGFVDITDEVQDVVESSGIENGQVTVYAREPGCRLIVNERESGLFADVRSAVERIGGATVDERRLVGSPSIVLPVAERRLRLGTWQRVLLIELDDGAERSVVVQIVGE